MRVRTGMAGLFVLFLASGHAIAAVFCAATTSSIQQAFAIAGSNDEADTIRIVIGSYAPAAGSIAFSYSSNEGRALTIEGGYTFGCGQRIDKAGLTVLSGSGSRQVVRVYGQGSGTVTVRNLTIEDGNAPTPGAGLSVEGPTGGFFVGFTGSVTVERVIFLGNRSTAAPGGLAIATRGGIIAVRGNLFAFNQCGDDNCALWIQSLAEDPLTVIFGGNTVALNTCISGSGCNSGGARFLGEQNAVIYDNLFAFHSGGDLSLQNPAVNADLYYNNIEVVIGSADTEVGTIDVANPEFVDALAEDFRLLPTSPLRNLGNAPFPLPGVDLDGKPRIIESAPELGAYEILDVLFADGFDGEP
jgi:hypothetical protein